MDDRRIVELYFERSEAAIKETKLKYSNYFFCIAYNILKNKEDAEECENDTYLKAWNSIPPNMPDPLLSYLGKIVRNLALQKHEYYTAEKRNKDLLLAFNEIEDCISSPVNPERQFIEGELGKEIDLFLRDIDLESRILFVKRYWLAESVKEISESCHFSESKIKSSLFRTRNRLKAYLKKGGYII